MSPPNEGAVTEQAYDHEPTTCRCAHWQHIAPEGYASVVNGDSDLDRYLNLFDLAESAAGMAQATLDKLNERELLIVAWTYMRLASSASTLSWLHDVAPSMNDDLDTPTLWSKLFGEQLLHWIEAPCVRHRHGLPPL